MFSHNIYFFALFYQLTSEMFEADLEKALLLSKLEYEEHRKVFLTFIKIKA